MKNYQFYKLSFVLFFWIPIFIQTQATPALAMDQKKITGLWIARQVFDRDRGKTAHSVATMVLINKQNNKKIRTFTNFRVLENGLEKQLIRFTSPADIAGTGFLTIEQQGYETDQFLYLPALRRTRRIVSSQKSHQFVNSDFTYEDMERHPVDNYLYEIKGEKVFANIDCYILETRPKKDIISQYSMTQALITKTSFVPVFAEYYNPKGQCIKTYTVVKLELKDNIWTESIVLMEDLINNHKTYIKLDQIDYNTDIRSDQISKTALETY